MAWQLYVAEFPNGKLYFGITSKGLKARERSHRKAVRQGSQYPVHLALRHYGEAVVFRTLVIGEREYIYDLEIRMIAEFKTRDRRYGYNVTLGGDLNPMLTPECAAKLRGVKKTPEHCAKLSAAHLGKKQDPEVVARRAATQRGRKRPSEACAATGAFWKGRKKSPEQIAKFIISRTGVKHSPETRARMSEMRTGTKRSAETKAKMSAKLIGNSRAKGFKYSPEQIAKRLETRRRKTRDGTHPDLFD